MSEARADAEVTDANFTEYFKDVRRNKPERGQCMARFAAIAYFEDGWVKKQVIQILKTKASGAESCRAVMRNLVQATEADSLRVVREIAEDLAAGMTDEEVLAKPYKFQLEQFYWTWPELVPASPHWETINVMADERLKFNWMQAAGLSDKEESVLTQIG